MNAPGSNTRFCTKCGAPNGATRFCTVCGAPVVEPLDDAVTQPVARVGSKSARLGSETPQPPVPERSSSMRPWIIAGSIVAAVIVLALVGVLVLGGDGGGTKEVRTAGNRPKRSASAAPTTPPTVAPTRPTIATSVTVAPTAAPTTPPRALSATADVGVQFADLAKVLSSFSTYVDGINSRDYNAAYAMLTPSQQQRVSFSQFSTGDSTSHLSEFVVRSAAPTGDAAATVRATFTSTQAAQYGANGQTCSRWDMSYALVRGTDGAWRIDGSSTLNGTPLAC